MKNKLLLYYDNGKSHLRVISKNAALPVHNCEDMLKADNDTFEFSVSYDSIDDVIENLDTIIKDAVDQIFEGGGSFEEQSYQILTADSEHAVAEFHCNNNKREEKSTDVNDLLFDIYKIVGK
jgi:hypothetical protein